jgi:hypothetical protein
MRNAYQRAMLFLTYIQGPIVNEWVKGVNAWLQGQIINQRWAPTDERLWVEVFDSFNRQFANVMEQEDAQAALAVTDLQGPPSERTPEQKLWDFKTRAQQYARDRESCDDVRISYLEFLETEAEDDLALARMIAG